MFRARWAALGVLLLSAIGRAQNSSAAAAEALFQQARDAMQAGDLASACPKFAESHRLDPAAGTLLNLAACYEQQGALADAWQTWHSALDLLSTGDPRRPEAQRLADALEARLPKLRVSLDAESPPAARVLRDGVELGAPSLGIELPVDPGEHLVEVLLVGHETARYIVTIEEGQRESLVVAPGPARPTPPSPVPPRSTDREPEVDADPPHRQPAERALGVSLTTLGVGSLVVGGVAGNAALGAKRTMDRECLRHRDQLYCNDAGIAASRRGSDLARVSTIGAVAGGAALAGGVTLLLVDRHERRRARLNLDPKPGGAQVSLVGRF